MFYVILGETSSGMPGDWLSAIRSFANTAAEQPQITISSAEFEKDNEKDMSHFSKKEGPPAILQVTQLLCYYPFIVAFKNEVLFKKKI